MYRFVHGAASPYHFVETNNRDKWRILEYRQDPFSTKTVNKILNANKSSPIGPVEELNNT
jgi:hypothetical protein